MQGMLTLNDVCICHAHMALCELHVNGNAFRDFSADAYLLLVHVFGACVLCTWSHWVRTAVFLDTTAALDSSVSAFLAAASAAMDSSDRYCRDCTCVRVYCAAYHMRAITHASTVGTQAHQTIQR